MRKNALECVKMHLNAVRKKLHRFTEETTPHPNVLLGSCNRHIEFVILPKLEPHARPIGPTHIKPVWARLPGCDCAHTIAESLRSPARRPERRPTRSAQRRPDAERVVLRLQKTCVDKNQSTRIPSLVTPTAFLCRRGEQAPLGVLGAVGSSSRV